MMPLYWILLCLLIYSFFGYGLLLLALSRLRPDRPVVPPAKPLRVTVLIAAHNEEGSIGRKLDDILAMDVAPHRLDVVVVSDGSTDQTVQEVRARRHPAIRLIELTGHNGKVEALNTALSHIGGDIVIFSDANSLIRPDAINELLKHFGDPEVGGVGSRLVVPSRRRSWLGRAEGLFWAYDNAMKHAESRLAGAVSAQGSLYAVRRELVSRLPLDVSDDLVTSLRVVAQGRRIVYEPKAVTEEAVSSNVSKEFYRRVRSTERGWRGLMMMAGLLNPFRFRFYSFQLASHKVLRRLSSFLLPIFFLVNIPLIPEGGLYAVTGVAQVGVYGMALLAWRFPGLRRLPASSVPLFFVMGHAAMAYGISRYMVGYHSERWIPAREA